MNPSLLRFALSLVAISLLSGAAMAQPIPPAADGNTESEVVATPGGAQVAPALKFANGAVDFGTVDEGNVVDVDYTVENASDRAVTIESFVTGCGCTAAAGSYPKQIPAGESFSFKLTYNTSGKRGTTNRTVTVVTNDAAQKDYRVTFTGKVVAKLYLEPAMLNFGNVDQGKKATQRVSLISFEEGGTKLESYTVADERVTAKLLEEKPRVDGGRTGTEFVFEVELPESMPQQMLNTQFTVKTDKSTYLPGVLIRANILGDVVANPPRMYVALRGSEPTSRTMTLTSRTGTPFRVVEVKPNGEFPASFEVQSGTNPGTQMIVATINNQGPPKNYPGSLIVTLENPGTGARTTMNLPFTVRTIAEPARNQATPPRQLPTAPHKGS